MGKNLSKLVAAVEKTETKTETTTETEPTVKESTMKTETTTTETETQEKDMKTETAKPPHVEEETMFLDPGLVSQKQVKMLRIAAASLSLQLSLPEADVQPRHMRKAEAEVSSYGSSWMSDVIQEEPAKAAKEGREARGPKEVREDIVLAFAGRFAMAEALTLSGVTRSHLISGLNYWKGQRNRRDVSPVRKAEGFLTRTGLEGEYVPKEADMISVSLHLPTGHKTSNALPSFGRQVAPQLPAGQAVRGSLVADVISNLAQRGASPEQIQNALQGLRAAGYLD